MECALTTAAARMTIIATYLRLEESLFIRMQFQALTPKPYKHEGI
ncbi:MAG: hypothetical protein QXT63_03300 [Thermoplasmata archaeon]